MEGTDAKSVYRAGNFARALMVVCILLKSFV